MKQNKSDFSFLRIKFTIKTDYWRINGHKATYTMIRTLGRQKRERAGLEGERAASGLATHSLGDLTWTIYETGIRPPSSLP